MSASTPSSPNSPNPPSDPVPPEIAPRLLCVDDEPAILSSLRRLFRPLGYTLFTANSGAEALTLLEKEPVDVVISDMRMPQMDGAQLLEQVFSRWPDTKRILLTGYADAEAAIAAINQGKIWRYVAKPWNDQERLLTVQQALAHRQLMRENARLTELTRRQNEELKALNVSLEARVEERTQQLQQALKALRHSFVTTVNVFSAIAELRDGKLTGHARRVADLARRLAKKLALIEAAKHCPNIIIADYAMPEMDGVTLLAELHRACPGRIGILMSDPGRRANSDHRDQPGRRLSLPRQTMGRQDPTRHPRRSNPPSPAPGQPALSACENFSFTPCQRS